MNAVKEAPDYLHDEHLSQGTKTYLNVLNGGGPAVESLPVPDARRVLADLQAAVPVDLSGVEESERTIESEGRTLRLNLVRPEGTGRERLPVFVFVHGGGWVLGDYPTHRRLVRGGFRQLYAFARSAVSAGRRGDLHCREMGGRKRP